MQLSEHARQPGAREGVLVRVKRTDPGAPYMQHDAGGLQEGAAAVTIRSSNACTQVEMSDLTHFRDENVGNGAATARGPARRDGGRSGWGRRGSGEGAWTLTTPLEGFSPPPSMLVSRLGPDFGRTGAGRMCVEYQVYVCAALNKHPGL